MRRKNGLKMKRSEARPFKKPDRRSGAPQRFIGTASCVGYCSSENGDDVHFTFTTSHSLARLALMSGTLTNHQV
jgi:hypothetical protein